MSPQDEIKNAIGAHGLWKGRLMSAIATGLSDYAPDQVCKDDLCDFGKWLYGSNLAAAMKKTPEFETCRALHADFHKAASEVLRLAVSGKKIEALDAMKSGSRYIEVSTALTQAMKKWAQAAAA